MKRKNLIGTLLAALIFGLNLHSFAQEVSVEPFLGMWALTLDYESSNAGWLEVRQEDGYLDADLLWRGGSVTPVDYTMVNEDQLVLVNGRDVVRKRDEKGDPVRTTHPVNWLQVTKVGENRLEGWAFFPNRDGVGVEAVTFSGKKIPAYGEAPKVRKIKYGEPIQLFNGNDLQGWELTDKKATSGWKVVDGVMVNNPVQKPGEKHIHYGNLRTSDTFEDFNLKLEVNIPKGNNSGVYLRGIYEVQVLDSYGKELDSHNMGALYSRITPLVAAEKPAGEWQQMDITLYQRHLTVFLNGKMLIDNQPVKGVTGGALTSDEFSPGPIYLQGDHGKVSYRNFVLTPVLK
ncbi:MAG: DUF1080 domain-containing protein [Bacteroidota bacterium]